MTPPHDTTPPPEGPPTSPGLPESVSELPIVAGDAAHTVLAAVANLVAAVVAIEKVAMACARAVDATVKEAPIP